MTKDTMKTAAVAADKLLFDDWSDAIEDGVRARVRGFIETMLEEELDGVLSRPRYGRRKPTDHDEAPPVVGCRHGHRKRALNILRFILDVSGVRALANISIAWTSQRVTLVELDLRRRSFKDLQR